MKHSNHKTSSPGQPRAGFGYKLGTLITYASMFGRWPTLDDLDARLQRLDRTDVILRLAWSNAYIEGWKRTQNNQKDQEIRQAWFPFWDDDFGAWSARFGEGFFFARHTVLWLIKRAFAVSCPDGERVAGPDAVRAFGEVCLIANDLSAFEVPKNLPGDLDVAANFLPTLEFFSLAEYEREISRTLHLFTNIAPNSAGTCLPEFALRIRELLGYEVTEYCDLVMATATKPIVQQADVAHFQLQTLRADHFNGTAIPVETAERFLRGIARDEGGFAERIISAQELPFDLTVFRETPLLLHEGAFVTLDSLFILDKAGKGLFWTAIKSAPSEERTQLLIDWGELFEKYVNELLVSSIPAHCRVLSDVRFADGKQAFDAAILERGTLVVFEHKASTINNVVKYGDNPAKLREVLESRFVVGEGTTKKGVGQLWNGINRFTQGDALYAGGWEIRPQDVREIMPVLVHLDNALRTIGIPHYMAERFRAFGRFTRHTVAPLVILPISELEDLEGHVQNHGLVKFLRSFLKKSRRDRTAVFLARDVHEFRGQELPLGPNLRRFERYFEDMVKRLFPKCRVG